MTWGGGCQEVKGISKLLGWNSSLFGFEYALTNIEKPEKNRRQISCIIPHTLKYMTSKHVSMCMRMYVPVAAAESQWETWVSHHTSERTGHARPASQCTSSSSFISCLSNSLSPPFLVLFSPLHSTPEFWWKHPACCRCKPQRCPAFVVDNSFIVSGTPHAHRAGRWAGGDNAKRWQIDREVPAVRWINKMLGKKIKATKISQHKGGTTGEWMDEEL